MLHRRVIFHSLSPLLTMNVNRPARLQPVTAESVANTYSTVQNDANAGGMAAAAGSLADYHLTPQQRLANRRTAK